MELYNAYYEWAGNVGDSILKLAQPDAVPTPPTRVRRRERAAAAAGWTSSPLTPAASHWLATASRTPAPRAPRGAARPRSARRPPVQALPVLAAFNRPLARLADLSQPEERVWREGARDLARLLVAQEDLRVVQPLS